MGQRGQFRGPARVPLRPVAAELGALEGLYLDEKKVVLSYSVGGMSVLELPALERSGNIAAFTRTLNLSPSTVENVAQIAFDPKRRAEWLDPSELEAVPAGTPARRSLVVLASLDTAAAAPVAPAALDQGLLGRWEFDGPGPSEKSVRSDSGAPRDLLLNDVRRAAEGHTGGALEFDGKHFAEISGAQDLTPLDRDLSVAAWVNTSADGTIFALTTPGDQWVHDGRALFLRGGKLTFDVGWVGAVAGSAKLNDGQWHHVAMTWTHENGLVTLFVDGQPDGSGNLKPRGPLASASARVGFAAPNFPESPWFRGRLDGLRLYGRALTGSEVAALAGQAPRNEVLVAALVGGTEAARWVTTDDGNLRLSFPTSSQPTRAKILLWSGAREALPEFAALVKSSPAPADLEPLTHGGPARWPEKPVTHGVLGTNDAAYVVDTLTEPDPNPWHSWMRFGGLDFFPDGKRAALTTWNGDVWIVSGVDGDLRDLTWQRIATGLFQPLGLKIVDNEIYVLGRDQITRLRDLNGNGETDFYENFNNDCMTSEHFHEFALDLKTGPDGNFYYIKCACHGVPAKHPHHGTLMRVSRDGSKLEVVARGFRAANGLGVGPNGEFTSIDNQGYWMPGNRVNWIKPGGWYGNQWAWNPENHQTYDEPLCWMHNFVDRSGGTQLWVPTDQWGPFRDDIITISYGMGHIFLLLKEEVAGQMQGAVTRFPLEFETGVMRGAWHPQSGQLYAAGLYGWAGNKTKAGGFYRIRYTGKPVHMAKALHFVRDGIVVGFTEPLDPQSATDPGNYNVTAWNYKWTVNYGSPDFKLNGQEGRDTWPVQSATLSADRKMVFLKVADAQRVMQLHVAFKLAFADGAKSENFIHGTIHNLDAKTGADWLGTGAIARADEAQVKLAQEAPGLVLSFAKVEKGGAGGKQNAAVPLTPALSPGEKENRVQPSNKPGAPASNQPRKPSLPLPAGEGRGEVEGGAGQPADMLISRLAALFVPVGAPPSAYLNAGSFASRWQGFLKLDLNDEITFAFEGRGNAALALNGQVVLAASDGKLTGVRSQPVSLRRGLNRFELAFESPPQGDAEFRLLWSSKTVPAEPVPSTAFVHDAADPQHRERLLARAGRELFAERQCAKCHQPAAAWTATAMPELAADAPAFDGIGSRLKAPWIAQWLLDPKAIRPDALMPKLLSGPQAAKDAADIAAFLASGTSILPVSPNKPEATSQSPTNLLAAGTKLFADLGCAACHLLPGELTLTNDTRVPLNHVAAKWEPAALDVFLRAPTNHFRWTRMPDFKLTADEAAGLAAFVLARAKTDPRWAAPTRQDSGDAKRGSELVTSLGCLSCHTLDKAQNQFKAPTLATLASGVWTRGCIADTEASRGKAPDFALTDSERSALRAFAKQDFPATLTRDCAAEFATRQYAALRCNACHPRDTETDLLTRLAAAAPKPKNAYDDEEGSGGGGSVHVGRPLLTYAGEKLYAGWMQRFLDGTLPYKPRPELQGRMPAFPAYAAGLATGIAEQHGYPAESAPPPQVDTQLADVGRRLTLVQGGFSCISCHNVGTQKALAGKDTATVNFACVAERLRPTYYWRYVQDPPRLVPSTMMPKFIGDDGTTPIKTVLNGDPQKQFTAIWNYLLSLRADAAAK